MNKLKLILTIGTVSIWHSLFCQITTDPALPNPEQEITITYDATLGTSSLVGANKVYMHSGVILSSETGTSWTNVVGNWGVDDGIGQMTKVEGESDKWEITINPRDYYDVPTGAIYRIGLVFRNENGSLEGKSDANGDFFIDLLQEGYGVGLVKPTEDVVLISQNEDLDIEVVASENSTFTLTINDVVVQTTPDITSFEYTHTVIESSGTIPVVIEATNGSETKEVAFEYVIRETPIEESVPAGIKKGINYYASDNTKVTLCLEAPLKNSVYVLGDFNDWEIDPTYLMKKDGDLFWLEISGLTANQEYRFQYMVDESIYVADPYSDKISDPEDGGISSSIYPDLITYPQEAYRDRWYYQRASVIETNRAAYEWEVADFNRPAQDELVIYELLIRDYFGSGQRSYQNLIDTLSYLSQLGVNAIQLMPITEFNGNESWGYNPTFMFAPDKSYGTREGLKKFIDEAHKLGIAVILDMVMNHQDIPGTNAVMYYNNGITADNPWFNVNAKHPFNVFFDFNHESTYTQDYLDSVNLYWLEEYQFDGFRYDLSKGFTQVDSGDDVGQWSSYDQSRINLLKRMADVVWTSDPDTYIILEHFADNNEEKELSDYGMMLWGNMNHAYNQLTMGYSSESIISGVSAMQRGWNDHHLVGYMESHDEERLMYRNIQFGNENSNYSTKDYNTALERVMAASAFFYTVPGPKMLWQFGETGFDYSINRCSDGSISDNCRLTIKPTTWSYLDNPTNQNLFEVTSQLIHLKTDYSLFNEGEVTFFGGANLTRYMWVVQNELENPTDASEMNALIVGNFDLTTKSIDVNFPHDGQWYHYFDLGEELDVTGQTNIVLQPGEFRLYTDVKLPETTPELISTLTPLAPNNLVLEDIEDGIQLSWNDESNINIGYRIYRSENGGSYAMIDEISDSEGYLDETVKPNGTYQYYIAAYNSIGMRTSEIQEVTAENVVLGVNDIGLLIYPNPNTINVTIESSGTVKSYSLHQMNGQLIRKAQADSNKLSINVSDLESGIYLIKIELQDGSIQTRKIIRE